MLYQGTDYEIKTKFVGWRFPTADADANVHYVVKREPEPGSNLGLIEEVIRNEETKKVQRDLGERPALPNARLLLQMEGERIWDGETEATIKTLLTDEQKPAIYKGKTLLNDNTSLAPSIQNKLPKGLEATRIKMTIPLSSVIISDQSKIKGKTVVTSQGLSTHITSGLSADEVLADPSKLIGNVIYVPQLYIERDVADLQRLAFFDAPEFPQYFAALVADKLSNMTAYVLEKGQERLPPSMYDIARLDNIFQSDECQIEISGTYIFERSRYERFFGKTGLNTEYVANAASTLSYSIMPFQIFSAAIQGENIIIESAPFISEIKVYPELTPQAYVIFSDNSFCKYSNVTLEDGTEWVEMNVDVDRHGKMKYSLVVSPLSQQ